MVGKDDVWAAGSATEAVGFPAALFADAWRVRQKKGYNHNWTWRT